MDFRSLALAYDGLPASLLLTVVVYGLFYVFLRGQFGFPQGALSGSAVLAVSTARCLLWLAFRRSRDARARIGTWKWLFVAGAVCAGATWSMDSVLFSHRLEASQQLFLALTVLAVAAVSIHSLSAQWEAMVGFLAAAILPVAIRLLSASDELLVMSGTALIAAVGSLATVGLRSFRSTRSLLETNARYAEIDRMKSEFLGLASHELRTPMTGILGFSELLLENPAIQAVERSWVATINDEAQRLTAIIDSLLDVSRIETGDYRPELGPVSLVDCVTHGARLAHLEHPSRSDVQLELEQGVTVVANEGRLTQVVTNLVSNAYKYSPNGGPVLITSKRNGAQLRISVIDHGLGIPAHHLGALFRRFSRIDSPDRSQIRGTGLGLYLVKQYVESFGGLVEVESEVGMGSTFTVVLPIGEEEVRGAA